MLPDFETTVSVVIEMSVTSSSLLSTTTTSANLLTSASLSSQSISMTSSESISMTVWLFGCSEKNSEKLFSCNLQIYKLWQIFYVGWYISKGHNLWICLLQKICYCIGPCWSLSTEMVDLSLMMCGSRDLRSDNLLQMHIQNLDFSVIVHAGNFTSVQKYCFPVIYNSL